MKPANAFGKPLSRGSAAMDRKQRVNISRTNRYDLANTFSIQQLSWKDLLEMDARRIPLRCGSRRAHAPAL